MKTSVVIFVVLLLCLGFAYSDTFRWLFEIWHEDEYSHGFVVLPFALCLAWATRARLRNVAIRPQAALGGSAVVFAAVVLLAGRASAYPNLEGVSLLLMVPAIVLFLLGWGWLRALAVPILYLNFMVPWYDPLTNVVRMPMQLFAANIGAYLLKLVGYPVYAIGTYLYLPHCSLKVAPECSGVAFVMSVLAIGFPLVYLTQSSYRRAAAVLASSVAIALLFNGIRVALVGVSAEKYGPALSHGPFHIFQGVLVAYVGVAVLLLINWVLQRGNTGKPKLYQRGVPRTEAGTGEMTRMAPSGGRVALLAAFLVSLGLVVNICLVARPATPTLLTGQLPQQIAGWTATSGSWIKGERFYPGVDLDREQAYQDLHGKRVFLHVSGFETQKRDKTIVNYRDQLLWQNARQVRLGSGETPASIVVSRPAIDGVQYVAAFWYEFPSGRTAGRTEAKLMTLWETIRHRRNAAAVVLVGAAVEGRDVDAAEEMILRFVRESHELWQRAERG